jgi:hypothetical protein
LKCLYAREGLAERSYSQTDAEAALTQVNFHRARTGVSKLVELPIRGRRV